MRKKTRNHIRRSLKHVMNAFAIGSIGFDKALASATCYVGMCKNCSGHNMMRWIEENFVLKRNEQTAGPEIGRRFYSINDNGDGTVDVYLRPDAGEDGNEVTVHIVRGVEPFDGLEEDIRARFSAWCDSAEVICL